MNTAKKNDNKLYEQLSKDAYDIIAHPEKYKEFNPNNNNKTMATIAEKIIFKKSDYDKLIDYPHEFYSVKSGAKKIIHDEDTEESVGVWDSKKEELTIKSDKLKKWLSENSYISEYADGGNVGSTIAELEAKIKKAKTNSMMPENLKKQYIAKIQKEIDAKHSPDTIKKRSDAIAAASAARDRASAKKPSTPTLPEWSGEDWEGEVYEELEEQGEMDRSDAQGVADANKSIMDKMYKANKSAKETAKAILKGGEEEKPKAKATDDDYDCDKIIADLKARKEKAKKAAKKADKTPTVNKDETAIEKIGDRIKKHYKEGELTQKQIVLLIRELTEQINELKKLLKTAK